MFLDFQQKSKNTWKILDFSRNQQNMEIQNFQKFLVHPIGLEMWVFFKEILEFLKFWYVVTTKSPLVNKLVLKNLYIK